MDDLDRRLLDLFAAGAPDRRARGVAAARRRPRHRPGPARQARRGRRDHRLGTGALPRGARLPGDGVPDPGDPPGTRPAGGHDAVARPPRRPSPRCSRRTRSPAPATCGPGWSPAPTPTSSGSSTGCSQDPAIVRSSTVIALATQMPYRVLPLAHRESVTSVEFGLDDRTSRTTGDGQVKIMQVEVAWATRRSAASRAGPERAPYDGRAGHRALGPEAAGVEGDRPEELHGEVERRVELAGRQVEWTAQPVAVSSSVEITRRAPSRSGCSAAAAAPARR